VGVNAKLSMTGSGSIGDISDWSVNESASPINITDNSAGTGKINIEAKRKSDTKFIINNNATLVTDFGSISGVVSSVDFEYNTHASISIDSPLSVLNVERNSPPTGLVTLEETIKLYIALVTGDFTVTYSATNNPSGVYGAWTGNVWEKIKQLCAANGVEIYLVGAVVTVRDVGSVILSLPDNIKVSREISTDASGKVINIIYQNYELVTPGINYNYSQNPSVETNATNWSATKGTYGTITSGRAT